MPLKIELPELFLLQVNDQGAVALPEIVLGPAGNNLPHLARISATVTGTPSSLARQLNQVYQTGFQSYQFTPDKIRLLPNRGALPRMSFKPGIPLPSDVACELAVEVIYHDSDASGKPILTAPNAKGKNVPVSQTLKVKTKLVTRKPGKCELRMAGPTVIVAEPGKDATRETKLAFTVKDMPATAVLQIRLATPEAVPYSDLRQELLAALARPFQKVGATSADGWETYELPIKLALGEDTRVALARRGENDPLAVPFFLDLHGAGIPTLSSNILVRCEERVFNGWLAIDFGTSNSTVTAFDADAPIWPVVGLAPEQENMLARLLLRWFERPAGDLAGIADNDWNEYLDMVGRELGGRDSSHLVGLLQSHQHERFPDILRQLEVCLGSFSPTFTEPVLERLHSIYDQTLRVPTLETQQLVPIDLDQRQPELASETEITGLSPYLAVEMGAGAKQHRLDVLGQAGENADPTLVERECRRFVHSPKRFFGKEKTWTVWVNSERGTVRSDNLIQAAWRHLIDRTSASRRVGRRRISDGKFKTAILTYPTVASPATKESIVEKARELGIASPIIDFDEAISAAIFYVMRELGSDWSLGLESFKARCRQDGQEWVLNLLVFDIGGGTTDLALIQLRIHEEDPFANTNESRGAGGRYYVIRPRVLGSTGHMHLGGELITLRTLIALKTAIVDTALQAEAEGHVQSDVLARRRSSLTERYLKDGRYNAGSLLEVVLNYLQRDPNKKPIEEESEALDLVNAILPTRWNEETGAGVGGIHTAPLQTFYTLWEHAEDAKIKIGAPPPPGMLQPVPFVLDGEDVRRLLVRSGLDDLKVNDVKKLKVQLQHDHFSAAARGVIEEAVGLAVNLVQDRLSRENERRNSAGRAANEKLDWLILSGKTCNLDLVPQQLRRLLSREAREFFDWHPGNVTFAAEFAKLATSVGACYAQKLRRFVVNPQGARPLLQRGISQIYFDVNNLFFYLSCGFARSLQDTSLETIFEAGTELRQLDSEPVGKARTRWNEAAQMEIQVYRQDFARAKGEPWAMFHLGEKLGFGSLEEFQTFANQRKIQLLFEVDHQLHLRLFVCQGEPHYEVAVETGPAFKNIKEVLPTGPAQPAGSLEDTRLRLEYDILVNVQQARMAGKDSAVEVLVPVGTVFDKQFHLPGDPDPNGRLGLIQPLKDAVFLLGHDGTGNRTLELHARRADGETKPLGTYVRPRDSGYQKPYYLTIDQHGFVAVHVGEVPFWMEAAEKGDPTAIRRVVGRVAVLKSDKPSSDSGRERDPFSGKH